MTPDQIKALIQQEIANNEKKGQFSVSKTSFHTHNGIDSPKLPLTSTEAGVSSIIAGSNVTISPTDGTGNVTINSAATTGVTSLAASGATASSPTGAVTITVSDATLNVTDITTNNVSISKHGFAPKSPNDVTKYLDGTGAYSVPPGSGSSITYANGIATRGFNDASSTQTIAHGLPSAPNYVVIRCRMALASSSLWTSDGIWNSSTNTQQVVDTFTEGGTAGSGVGATTGLIAYIVDISGDGQQGVLTVDATNIYIAWTKLLTPSGGTIAFSWEANT